MLRLGFDLDGVVADFRTAFLQVASELLGAESIQKPGSSMPDLDAVSPDHAKRVWKAITSTSNWWVGLTPYEPLQIARLYQLARRFRWEVSFLTTRVPTAGDSVQVQSQAWLERHGYYMPAVFTVPGSRGEIANGLRLDLVIDDQLLNCLEIVGASQTKAILILQHKPDAALEQQATDRGIGVVHRLEEAIDVLLKVQDLLPKKRGAAMRLAEWFGYKSEPDSHVLPMNPRASRPMPPSEGKPRRHEE
jgi:hypothetical protein